jgi:hypothetical protein
LMLFYSGGETDVSNCQILQSRVNRFKSNRSDVGDHDLRQFSCELKFSGMCLLLCDDPASFSVLCLKKHGKWR